MAMGFVHAGMYVAASGAYGAQRKLEAVANNIANASTLGYKRDYPVFRTPYNPVAPITPFKWKIWYELHLAQRSQAYLLLDETYTDFTEGDLERTGRTYDLAIHGRGFFAVQTPWGIRYTRAGNFYLSPEGYLITPQGYRVLTTDGVPLRIPVEEYTVDGVRFDENGDVIIGVRAGEERRDELLGRLLIVDFEDLKKLEKVGENLFKADMKPKESEFKLMQGYLETSNVNPMEEMVYLIESARLFESVQRVVRAYDETISRAVTEIGRV